jgi:hypothetical protein
MSRWLQLRGHRGLHISAGIGIKVLDAVDVDVAGTYIVLKSKVDVATPDNAGVGIYAAHVAQFSASASFHM